MRIFRILRPMGPIGSSPERSLRKMEATCIAARPFSLPSFTMMRQIAFAKQRTTKLVANTEKNNNKKKVIKKFSENKVWVDTQTNICCASSLEKNKGKFSVVIFSVDFKYEIGFSIDRNFRGQKRKKRFLLYNPLYFSKGYN